MAQKWGQTMLAVNAVLTADPSLGTNLDALAQQVYRTETPTRNQRETVRGAMRALARRAAEGESAPAADQVIAGTPPIGPRALKREADRAAREAMLAEVRELPVISARRAKLLRILGGRLD